MNTDITNTMEGRKNPADTTKAEGINVELLNITGLRGKQPYVKELCRDTHIVGLCESWIRHFEGDLIIACSEHTAVILPHNQRRGYGGVCFLIHPLIKYTPVAKEATATY